MKFDLLNILSLLNVLIFISLMLFSRKERNKFYLLYILLSYPFLSNYSLPSVNTFVLITMIHLVFFYKKSNVELNFLSFYSIVTYLFITSIIIGFFINGIKMNRDKFIYISQITALLIYSKILISELNNDITFLKKIILSLKVTLFFSFIFLIIQVIFGPEVSLSRTMNPNIILINTIRYPSFLSDPQVYAQFLGMIGFLCLIKDKESIKNNFINYLLLILSIISIFFTGARAGLTGLILGFFILIIFNKSKHSFALILSVGLAYLISINFRNSLSIFNRGGDINDTYDFRFSIWTDAVDIFKKNPLFGIGVGNYSQYASIHLPDQYWLVDNEIVYFDHPESGYLKFLIEFGVSGFLCFLLLFIVPVLSGIKKFFYNRNISIIIFISSLVCWMVGFYSTFSFGDIRIAILVATVICMLIVLNSVEKDKRRISLNTYPKSN